MVESITTYNQWQKKLNQPKELRLLIGEIELQGYKNESKKYTVENIFF